MLFKYHVRREPKDKMIESGKWLLCGFAIAVTAGAYLLGGRIHDVPRESKTFSDCIWEANTHAWLDANEDGKRDPDELALRGVLFRTDDTHNGYRDVASARTDGSGNAQLRVWLPGCPKASFELSAEIPGGYRATSPIRGAVAYGEVFQVGFIQEP